MRRVEPGKRRIPILDDVSYGRGGIAGGKFLFVNDTENPVYHRRLSLPGTSGSYASTPDSAAVSIAGDLDIRAKLSMDDWTPTGQRIIVGKYGAQFGYALSILTSGVLNLQASTDGSTQSSVNSGIATGFVDGSTHWVRVTRSGVNVNFYTSEDGETWTLLGSSAAFFAGAIFDSNATVGVGSWEFNPGTVFAGKIYRAQLYDGIAGTLVADFNADDATAGDLSFVSRGTGETWTINGAASIERID